MRRCQIVFHAALFDDIFVEVVNTVSRAPVGISRLAHTACVNKIFLCHVDPELFNADTFYAFIANECHRHVRVAEKTNSGVLISEAGGGVQIVEDITPLRRRIEGGVHNGEIAHLPLEAHAA